MKRLGVLILSFLLISTFTIFFPRVKSEETPVQFSPLQQIINKAQEGSTIKVAPGTYYGVTKVNKTLTLIGNDVVLDANGWHIALLVTAPHVILRGFRIQNTSRYEKGYPSQPELSELQLRIAMMGSGIFVHFVTANISQVTVSNCYAGIGFTNSPGDSYVINCTITHCFWGVLFFDACYVTIFNSVIRDNLFTYYYPDGNVAETGGGGIWLWDNTQMNMTYTTLLNTNWALTISNLAYFSRVRFNNFVNNTHQVYICPGAKWVAEWDRNYWSDYAGSDLYSGQYQNVTGSDGIGDTPYIIDFYNKDNHPSMEDPSLPPPPPPNPADLNNDGKVDIKDVAIVALAYGSSPESENWNPIADVNKDGKVDIKDVAIVALAYGN